MRILLPLIDLLLELPRLLFIHKTHPKHAFFAIEAEEENSVLVEGEGVVDLLVPYHSSLGGRDVDEFEPEGVAHEVVGEDCGALEAGVGPSLAVWVGDVEFGDGDGVDFVGGFGDGAFDCLLFVIVED